MNEALKELLPVLVSGGALVITALCGCVVAWLNNSKAKAELNQEKAELEKQKLSLEETIYNGSYIICPNCGHKIRLGDVNIQIDRNGGSN